MKYFTQNEYETLLKNGSNDNPEKDDFPVVKLILTNSNISFLISELDPDLPTFAYGLCDLGLGYTELGWFILSMIEKMQIQNHILETDPGFIARYPLSVYFAASKKAGKMVTDGLITPSDKQS